MSISGIKLKIASKRSASRIQDRTISEGAGSVESVVVILDRMEVEVVKCFGEIKEFLHLRDENFKMLFSVACKDRMQNCEDIYFNPADITWTGDFRGELQQIRDRRFDVLICFTKECNKVAQFLSAALDARLKVSRENLENAVFDLSISTDPEEVEIFTKELKKYLRILNRVEE